MKCPDCDSYETEHDGHISFIAWAFMILVPPFQLLLPFAFWYWARAPRDRWLCDSCGHCWRTEPPASAITLVGRADDATQTGTRPTPEEVASTAMDLVRLGRKRRAKMGPLAEKLCLLAGSDRTLLKEAQRYVNRHPDIRSISSYRDGSGGWILRECAVLLQVAMKQAKAASKSAVQERHGGAATGRDAT